MPFWFGLVRFGSKTTIEFLKSFLVFNLKFNTEDWSHLSTNGRYMLVCNHQSWSDIYIIQSVLNRKIPLIRFFIKEQLKYVPILGTAWLALDFPFVKRSSKKDLIKNPELANQDLQNVRNVCKKFIGYPFSILNFVEGTRRTPEKVAKIAKKILTITCYVLIAVVFPWFQLH